MDETSQLGLPLLQPAQAQKHVTVNEGMAKLDGLTQMSLASVGLTTPPLIAVDGDCYSVPTSAVNEWSGHDGELAIYANGGWVFSVPKIGWRGWIIDQGKAAVFDGTDWQINVISMASSGTSSLFEVLEFDHVLSAGSFSDTLVLIPENAMVFMVTGRVKTVITGALTSWQIGIFGDEDRYASGLALTQGTSFIGSFGKKPQVNLTERALRLTADGGDFAAGEVRIAIHYYTAAIPTI